MLVGEGVIGQPADAAGGINHLKGRARSTNVSAHFAGCVDVRAAAVHEKPVVAPIRCGALAEELETVFAQRREPTEAAQGHSWDTRKVGLLAQFGCDVAFR